MSRRRVSAWGGHQAPPSQRGTYDRVRRITRNRQAPRRYGHVVDLEAIQPEQEEIQEPESISDQVLPSEYSQSTQADIKLTPSTNANESDAYTQSATMEPASRPASSQQSTSGSQVGISLEDMRQLLRSHRQDIIDRVVLQLRSKEHNLRPAMAYVNPTISPTSKGTKPSLPRESAKSLIWKPSLLSCKQNDNCYTKVASYQETLVGTTPSSLNLRKHTRAHPAQLSQ